MAQTKFKLHTEENTEVTHAHAQHEKIHQTIKDEIKITPIDTKGTPVLSGINLGISLIKLFEILTPTQKQQLLEYAQKDDKTASCIIKELLVEKGIVEKD